MELSSLTKFKQVFDLSSDNLAENATRILDFNFSIFFQNEVLNLLKIELVNNLIQKETTEGKIAIIRYYLSEIYLVSPYYEEKVVLKHKEDFIKFSGDEIKRIREIYSSDIQYKLIWWRCINHTFQTIEELAYTFGINFNNLLLDLKIEIDFFRYEIYTQEHKSFLCELNSPLTDNLKMDSKKNAKLKWSGRAAHLGYIMNELAEKGFIEIPKTNGDPSYNKFAKVLLELFEIETTPSNLANEVNPNKNTLGKTNRLKFKVPNITDLI